MNEIGQFLKKLRGKMSLREASEKSGLSHSYIDSLEKGRHPKTKAPIRPSPDSLKALSIAYNFPYEELMKIAGYIDSENIDNNNEIYEFRPYNEIIQHIKEHYPGVDINDPSVIRKLKKAIDLVLDDYEKKQ